MSKRHLLFAAALLPLAAACQTDQEPFREGADLETPPAVEQAPAMPTPTTEPATSPADTMTPLDADTLEGGASAPANR